MPRESQAPGSQEEVGTAVSRTWEALRRMCCASGPEKGSGRALPQGSPRASTGLVWAQLGNRAGKLGAGSETLILPTYASQRLCLTSGDNEVIWEPQAVRYQAVGC